MEHCLGPVAKRILPNHRRYEISGKPGQEISPNIAYSDDSKMCIHLCTAHLGLPRSAPQLQIVKHEKLEQVLDTIFWDIWAESVHREMLT